MLSEEEIMDYRKRVEKQLSLFEKLDVDPHNNKNTLDYNLIITFKEGQVFALNNILDGFVVIKKNVSFSLSGTSDDLIELDGDISDELGAYDVVRKFVLSDGTYGTIEYDGVWRINILESGSVEVNIIHPTQDEIDNDTNYTDKATFTGNIEWIIFDDGQIFKPRCV
jgi:hypothetical protein